MISITLPLPTSSVSYTHLDVYKRQQLEYILAVDELRHFAKAAEYCNVTQPDVYKRQGLFHQHKDGDPLPSAKSLYKIVELARAIIFPRCV